MTAGIFERTCSVTIRVTRLFGQETYSNATTGFAAELTAFRKAFDFYILFSVDFDTVTFKFAVLLNPASFCFSSFFRSSRVESAVWRLFLAVLLEPALPLGLPRPTFAAACGPTEGAASATAHSVDEANIFRPVFLIADESVALLRLFTNGIRTFFGLLKSFVVDFFFAGCLSDNMVFN